MDSELKDALRKLAEGRHPEFDWPITANHVTHVNYVGITGRKGGVQARVIHPPRVGDHIRWMKFSKGDARCQITVDGLQFPSPNDPRGRRAAR